jgi:hypothetical protein
MADEDWKRILPRNSKSEFEEMLRRLNRSPDDFKVSISNTQGPQSHQVSATRNTIVVRSKSSGVEREYETPGDPRGPHWIEQVESDLNAGKFD